MLTFGNTLSHLHRQVGVEWQNLRIVGVSIWEKVWLENSLSQLEGGWWGRRGSSYKAKDNIPHGGRGLVCERDMARVRVGHGMAGQNCCVVGGCLLSLSLCRRGFQDLLKVRPSSLLILCGCFSSSVACHADQAVLSVGGHITGLATIPY